MSVDPEQLNQAIFSELWESGSGTYEAHPTSRHRRNFAVQSLANEALDGDSFVFDYGCGSGALLEAVGARYGLRDDQLGGCDITEAAVRLARSRIASERLYLGKYPELDRDCAVILCTEVIEHTPDYRDILAWAFEHLAPGGLLVLTTPGTPMDPPDVEYGHVQHFELSPLVADLEAAGFEVAYARRWGFPFFTAQKLVTRLFYDHIRKHVIESEMNVVKRAGFALLYRLYFLHYLVSAGPQIFIRARKPAAR